MNKVTIHQCETGMYLGLIDKILQSDTFVIFDMAQFEKNYWGNRFSIRTKEGSQVITIPVESHNHKSYNELKIIYQSKWQKTLLKTIEQNYSKARHFNEIFPTVQEIFSIQYNSLAELNIALLKWVLSYLNYQGKIVLASELNLDPSLKATDLLVEICKKVGATTYLSGISGKAYLEVEKFGDIKVEFQSFLHPWYKQVYSQFFVPMLSVIDLLMCYGLESRKVINCKGGISLRHILDTKIPNWKELSILEMFAGCGSGELQSYANDTNNVTMWELDSLNYLTLCFCYPNAQVKQCDSFKELFATSKTFDVVIIDAPASMDVTFICNNVSKIINKHGYIIIRAVKESWNNNPNIPITKNYNDLVNDLSNLTVVSCDEFQREFFYSKQWLSNYFYEVLTTTL